MPFLSALRRRGALSLPGAPVHAAPPEITFEKYRMQNGLDVILHVDHAVPIVHVEVWYKVGSKDEAPGKTGSPPVRAHDVPGDEADPRDAYFKYLGQAGASARNGSTSTDRTNYFETLPSSELELGLWLESSRMGFSSIALISRDLREPTRRGEERAPAAHRERASGRRRPRGIGGVVSGWPPYRHEVMGSMKDLDAATEVDIRGFFTHNYAPNNAVLLIAGDFDVARVKGLVEKYFGPIPAGPPVPRQAIPPIPAPPANAASHGGQGQPGASSWLDTVPLLHPGCRAGLLAKVLGGGKSSRLTAVWCLS